MIMNYTAHLVCIVCLVISLLLEVAFWMIEEFFHSTLPYIVVSFITAYVYFVHFVLCKFFVCVLEMTNQDCLKIGFCQSL